MRFKGILALLALVCSMVARAQINVIYDDDFADDMDVATNMATLHKLADKGYLNVLGIIVDGGWPQSVGIAKVFDNYFQRPGLYVGAYQGSINNAAPDYAPALLTAFGVSDTRAAYPDCVAAYRTMLAKAAAQSVAIVITGGMTCLSPLMQSPADGISSMTGTQLIKSRVTLLSFMGGEANGGTEHNFAISPADTAYVFSNWTAQNGWPPMYGIDGSTGLGAISGPYALASAAANPVKKIFDLKGQTLHPSWDSLAILFAAVQFGTSYNNAAYFGDRGNGTISVNGSTGADTYSTSTASGQHYLSIDNYVGSALIDGYNHCCGFAGMPPGNGSGAMVY